MANHELYNKLGITDRPRAKRTWWDRAITAIKNQSGYSLKSIDPVTGFLSGLAIALATMLVVIFIDSGVINIFIDTFGVTIVLVLALFTILVLWLYRRKIIDVWVVGRFISYSALLVVIPFAGLLTIITRSPLVAGNVGYYTVLPLVNIFQSSIFIDGYSSFLVILLITGIYKLYPFFMFAIADEQPFEVVEFQPAELAPMMETVKPVSLLANPVGDLIISSLKNYGLEGLEFVTDHKGPLLSEYVLRLPPQLKGSKVLAERDNLCTSLANDKLVINSVVPHHPNCISVLIPNEGAGIELVNYADLITDQRLTDRLYTLPLLIGKNMTNDTVISDLTELKHLLIGGTTGSGKSKLVETMLLSLLTYVPSSELDLIIIDPKMVEMLPFEVVPHLRGNRTIIDPVEALQTLEWVCEEMENRYLMMRNISQTERVAVRNIKAFNQHIGTVHRNLKMKYLVVVVDELADLMMNTSIDKKVLEALIIRIAQKGRACGIHLILATQRPTVDVVSGLIKANMPCRIALTVSSQVDSRVIIDATGAELLLERGDMLISHPSFGSLPYRAHGAYVSEDDLEHLLGSLV